LRLNDSSVSRTEATQFFVRHGAVQADRYRALNPRYCAE
jgi:hypothetical protein